MDFPWLRLRGELSGSGPLIDVVDERGFGPAGRWTGFTPRRPQPPEHLGSPPPPEPSLLVE